MSQSPEATTPSTRAEQVLQAKYPEDLFGEQLGAFGEQILGAYEMYREFAKVLHPDNQESGDEEAFKRLQQLWEIARTAFDQGTYGKREQVENVLVTTRKRAYRVSRIVARGDASIIYAATYYKDGEEQNALLKVIADPANSRELVHEAKVVRQLREDGREAGRSTIIAALDPYIPSFIEAFGYRQGKKTHQALAYKSIDGLISLSEVKKAFPNGVHPKDSAWMLRRLLLTIGLTHSLGWCHEQVSERHVLIHPEEHGLVLIDWRKASEWSMEGRARDIRNSILVICDLTTESAMPERLRRFYEGCLNFPKQLPDALKLRDEYTEILEDIWGPRTFRPFIMPGCRI